MRIPSSLFYIGRHPRIIRSQEKVSLRKPTSVLVLMTWDRALSRSLSQSQIHIDSDLGATRDRTLQLTLVIALYKLSAGCGMSKTRASSCRMQENGNPLWLKAERLGGERMHIHPSHRTGLGLTFSSANGHATLEFDFIPLFASTTKYCSTNTSVCI